MRSFIKWSLIIQILISGAFAAGDGHSSGSPFDLKWAFLNTILLFSFLVWKLKKPMKEMFDSNSKEVAELYEYANSKEKDAQIRLDALKTKMANLGHEKKKIVEETHRETQSFIQRNEEELSEYVNRIESDARVKLATEKSMLERDLNNSLIDEVIASAKTQIKSSGDVNQKINDKILAQVR